VQVNYTPGKWSGYGWWDSSGTKHYASVVDENTNDVWYYLNMNQPGASGGTAEGVTRISFQDNNGQAPGSTYIGWGNSASYGIDQLC
jgi:hypothetical protein